MKPTFYVLAIVAHLSRYSNADEIVTCGDLKHFYKHYCKCGPGESNLETKLPLVLEPDAENFPEHDRLHTCGDIKRSYTQWDCCLHEDEELPGPYVANEPPTPTPTPVPIVVPTVVDKDCILSNWSAWSACSKMCASWQIPGHKQRTKSVLQNSTGNGVCPAYGSAERSSQSQCNAQACPNQLVCTSKLDIIIAIDGSGSVREAGFQRQKSFVTHLIDSMNLDDNAGVMVGLMLVATDPQILHYLSSDKTSLKQTVEQLVYPASAYGYTARALRKSLEVNGREGTKRIVVVIADGISPETESTVQDAASQLTQQQTRLMFVYVGNNFGHKERFYDLATYPPQNNVIAVPSFQNLADNQNNFVADVCVPTI
jgi:hypothetical protein